MTDEERIRDLIDRMNAEPKREDESKDTFWSVLDERVSGVLAKVKNYTEEFWIRPVDYYDQYSEKTDQELAVTHQTLTHQVDTNLNFREVMIAANLRHAVRRVQMDRYENKPGYRRYGMNGMPTQADKGNPNEWVQGSPFQMAVAKALGAEAHD